jgi:high-affinity Fe2+/Pb2+ permease
MEDWDLTSIGLVLIGSSITAAGTIIAALLLGITISIAPFLLITTSLLIVISAILILYGEQKTNARK